MIIGKSFLAGVRELKGFEMIYDTVVVHFCFKSATELSAASKL